MKEIIFEFVNQYVLWGILLAVCLAAVLQWRMHRQMKKLNRSLGAVTGKIQEYFNIIMEEEKEERFTYREDRALTKEEQEMLLSKKPDRSLEDEEVFNAVMQEYFS